MKKLLHKQHTKRDGFSILEATIAIAVAILVFVGIYQIIVLSIRTTDTNLQVIEAVHRAEESVEVTRTLRNESWGSNIASLTIGNTYYPIFENSTWSLSTTPPNPEDAFIETIVLSNVYRDESDNIAESGTLDPNSRKVTATVSWENRGFSRQESVETYITNFLDN